MYSNIPDTGFSLTLLYSYVWNGYTVSKAYRLGLLFRHIDYNVGRAYMISDSFTYHSGNSHAPRLV